MALGLVGTGVSLVKAIEAQKAEDSATNNFLTDKPDEVGYYSDEAMESVVVMMGGCLAWGAGIAITGGHTEEREPARKSSD